MSAQPQLFDLPMPLEAALLAHPSAPRPALHVGARVRVRDDRYDLIGTVTATFRRPDGREAASVRIAGDPVDSTYLVTALEAI